MRELFMHMLEASLYGSVVILAILLLRLVLKKAPRSVFCFLWLLAGLRLMLPMEIESSFSLQPRLEPVAMDQSVEIQVPEFITASTAPAQEVDTQQPDTVKPDTQENKVEDVKPSADTWESTSFLYEVADGQIRPLDYGDIAAWVWAAGIAVLGGASLVSYWKLKKQVREAYLLENGCWECASIETAFVLGFMPPRIYLPMGLSAEDRKFIFDHENTHIARHDHWYKLLGYVVLAFHWFNPLVWLAYSLLCRDIELACDEHVVKYMSVDQRKAYSAALLNCSAQHLNLAACPVAFGETSVKQRILSVLHYKKPGFWITLVAVIAVVFVVVCLMTSPGTQEPDLSFLNYENAISLATEQEEVTTIYCDETSIRPGQVSGSQLAAYLEGANWRERWFEPGDQSSPGSVEFVIGDEYRITVYDRNFARVKYGEVVRWYSIGWGDYADAKALLEASDTPETTQTQPLSTGDAFSRAISALEAFQQQENYHVSVRLSSHTGNYTDIQNWQAGDDWLSTSRVNGADDQTSYLKKGGIVFNRHPSTLNGGALSDWIGGFILPDESRQMPWLRVFDWSTADIRMVRQGTQAEIETLPYAEGPFEMVTCLITGPFEVYQKTAYAGILTVTFDGDGALAAVELVATLDETVLDGEITEESVLAHNTEMTQVTTQLLPSEASEISKVIDETFSQVSREEWEKAYLAKCREAVEALQRQTQYHLTESSAYYAGDVLDSTTEVEYWYGEANWVRESYVERRKETSTYLYLDGYLYFRLQPDDSEPVWERFDLGHGTDITLPWLCDILWDEQEVTFVDAINDDESLFVIVTIHSTPRVLRWSDVTEYTVYFAFDMAGNLYGADMTCKSGSDSVVSTVRIQDTSEALIRDKIQFTAAQRPPEVCVGLPLTAEGYLDKCRWAVEDFQMRESSCLLIDRQFSGRDALNSGSSQLWYGSGEDWVCQNLISESPWTDEKWYLFKDGEEYSRYIYNLHDPDNEESSDTGWLEGFQNPEGPPDDPWLVRFDWDAQEITFVEHTTEGSNDLITFTVQGNPFETPTTEVSEYQVTFVFRASGELWKVLKSYTQTWRMMSNGVETTGILYTDTTITIEACPDEEAVRIIDEKYREATGA